MKLMTKEIEKKLLPIGSTDGQGKQAKVVVKFFNPTGPGTWLITEGEQQEDGDWLLYGYCFLTTWEWSYTVLSELTAFRGQWGLPLERDLYAHGTVEDLAND